MAVEQNTQAIQAQTRDSLTEKQMTYSEWIGTSPEATDVFSRGSAGMDQLDGAEATMFTFLVFLVTPANTPSGSCRVRVREIRMS